jgi:predicted hydrocarbon binding protein
MTPPDFKDRLVFDTADGAILDANRRYLLLRHDTFMGIFTRLPPPARREALEALEAAVLEHGADSARAYRASGAGDARGLIAIIERTAPQLGWGRWSFTIEERCLRLEVVNSPFADGSGMSADPVCHAILGMLRVLAAELFGEPATARERACAACGAARCSFEALPGVPAAA